MSYAQVAGNVEQQNQRALPKIEKDALEKIEQGRKFLAVATSREEWIAASKLVLEGRNTMLRPFTGCSDDDSWRAAEDWPHWGAEEMYDLLHGVAVVDEKGYDMDLLPNGKVGWTRYAYQYHCIGRDGKLYWVETGRKFVEQLGEKLPEL